MEKELSIQEIINTKEQIKEVVRNASAKRFFYEIFVKNPIFSPMPQKFSGGDNRDGDCYGKFCAEFDNAMNNTNVVEISVTLKNGQGRVTGTYTLPLVTPKMSYIEVPSTPPPHDETPAQTVQPQPEPRVAPNTPNADMVRGVLTLLGFDAQGLDGVGDGPFGGLGAIMAVRDKQIENRYLEKDREERQQRLMLENAQQKSRIEELTKKLEASEAEIEKLNNEIGDMEEEIEKLEKLKPEYSLAGTSLVGVLTKVGENLLNRNAGLIGGLMGVDETTMLSLLNKGGEASDTPAVDVQPVAAQETPRDRQIAEISKFMRTLPDTQFAYLWEILRMFYQNHGNIEVCYKWAYGKTAAAPQSAAVGDTGDDTDDVEIVPIED